MRYSTYFFNVLHVPIFLAPTTTTTATENSLPHWGFRGVLWHCFHCINFSLLEQASHFAKGHTAAISTFLTHRWWLSWWLSGYHLSALRTSFPATRRQATADFPFPCHLIHAGTNGKVWVNLLLSGVLIFMMPPPIDNFDFITFLRLQSDVVNNFLWFLGHFKMTLWTSQELHN